MRRSVVNSGSKRNYFVYAIGEIILVVFGILIALQVNNWNEERKEAQLELDILHEIRDGLIKDASDIEYNISAHKRILNSQTILINWLDSDRPYHDSLADHFSISNNSTVFVSNEGAYAALKEIGIRIIRNDTLRNEIIDVYDRDFDYYRDHIAMYNELVFNAWKNVNMPYFEATLFKFSNSDNAMPPLSPSKIRSDNAYKYNLKTTAEFNEFYIERIMTRAYNAAVNLVDMIESELEERK